MHWFWAICLIHIRGRAGIKTSTGKWKKDRERMCESGSHMEDTSFNITFIILQQPLEKRQLWGCVEHTALMTTTGSTQWTLENGHQMFKEEPFFLFYLLPFIILHLVRHASLLNSQILQRKLNILVYAQVIYKSSCLIHAYNMKDMT